MKVLTVLFFTVAIAAVLLSPALSQHGVYHYVLQVSKKLVHADTAKAEFRDSGLFINSAADGKLTYSSDGTGTDDHTFSGTVTFSNTVYLATSQGDTNSFTTTATADTVVNTDFGSGAVFVVSINDATPVANDLLGWTNAEDTLFVHRPAGTTSGLKYSWVRIR